MSALKQTKQYRHKVELGDSEKQLSVTKVLDTEFNKEDVPINKEHYIIETEYQSIDIPLNLFQKLLDFPKVFVPEK